MRNYSNKTLNKFIQKNSRLLNKLSAVFLFKSRKNSCNFTY
ncbi:hypothetical protein TRIP_D40006 [uncultured Paludibacter sp.]|uniref:Uncharacterized protein n=1 Tax=uncultured Paludibacter sp. TaxID=497635 RepID=A0A653AFH1_9BACT|nr:hypothetical protein TRIP_D40006 [uncultured Paludibacter sp.]